MDNHILEGTYPSVSTKFTPKDAHPKSQIATMISSIDQGGLDLLRKMKPKASPPSIPACERLPKKLKLKPAVGAKDFTKAGLFHCKDGFQTNELFPLDLSKTYCSFFVSTIRDAPNPIRLVNSSMLEGGRRSLPEIRRKFVRTAMLEKAGKSDLAPTHS